MQVTMRQFVRDLKAILGNHSVQKAIQLGKGQVGTIEEYKKTVGFIAGLDAAAEIAEKMMTQIEESSLSTEGELPEMPLEGEGG